jgi:hypothetical protein
MGTFRERFPVLHSLLGYVSHLPHDKDRHQVHENHQLRPTGTSVSSWRRKRLRVRRRSSFSLGLPLPYHVGDGPPTDSVNVNQTAARCHFLPRLLVGFFAGPQSSGGSTCSKVNKMKFVGASVALAAMLASAATAASAFTPSPRLHGSTAATTASTANGRTASSAVTSAPGQQFSR